MTNFSHFGPSFSCDVLTHIHTSIHRFYEPKYILDGFINLTLRSKCYSEFFVSLFPFTHMEKGVVRLDPAQVTPKVKIKQPPCIPCFRSVTPKVCLAKVLLLAFFGLT